MNLIDAQVIEVLGVPIHNVEYYKLQVKYIDMGGEGTTDLVFDTEEEALKVDKGYVFQH